MAFHLLAGSDCQGGNCPTLWQDDETGAVKVRGYHPAHVNDPAHELDVIIPAETWTHLVSQLPR